MNSEKSINSFEIKKKMGYVIFYGTIIFFLQFVNNFSAFLLCKIHVSNIFNTIDF